MDAKQRRVMIPLVAVVVVLCVVVVGLVMTLQDQNDAEPAADSGGAIGYADGVTVVDDESALQAAVDQMMKDAKNEMVASFQNQAFSEDGKTFTCYIANSEYNEYDMFIALYKNLNDEEPIYLSGLMRPGEAFREIVLDEALGKGDHTVNLVFTQVEDDHSTIHGQSIVTITMQVN